MVIMPDNPESSYLQLYQSLLKATSVFPFAIQEQISLKFELLKYLAIQLQEQLPYHIEGVQSNDHLFKENAFKNEIYLNIDHLLNKILEDIHSVINPQQFDILVLFRALNVIHSYFKLN
jgi:hypothetical protein